MNENDEKIKENFLRTRVRKDILFLNMVLTVVYFYVIAFAFPIGNKFLFSLLIFGEIFHVYQALSYMYTIWQTDHSFHTDPACMPTVDVFITVAGEPVDIIEKTILAAQSMTYPRFKVYVLNDGYVAKKDNWKDVEFLAVSLGARVITRKIPGGAKAGNINNALEQTKGDCVAIFDADHVPHRDFLRKVMPYFADEKMAFVQTPQYYKNYALNYITLSSWAQQELFFGPICKGRNRFNAVSMCGTNMVIRRSALADVGGMDKSITEDFITSVFMHKRGWKSAYIPEVLAEGLAPEDFLSYYKQQFRWARGSLDMIFRNRVFFQKGLTWKQKLNYFSAVSFYFSGIVVVIDALLPLFFLFYGTVPIFTSTMKLAAVFIPYMFVTLYILEKSTNYSFAFRALAFSMASFTIHVAAFFSSITGEKVGFAITPKKRQRGNFTYLVIPHMVYVALVLLGMFEAYSREGLSASFITNSVWALLNVSIFLPFIYAATPWAMNKRVSESILESEFDVT